MHLIRHDLRNTIQFHKFQHDDANKISYEELTSCNVHTVNRKCRRVQIPMSFGPSFRPALLQNNFSVVHCERAWNNANSQLKQSIHPYTVRKHLTPQPQQ